ncbi:CheY-like superfamily [Xylogone sp. PMI_703]|nr:CheY-like superfamily [Xylogone sp. PMI_703]
MHVLVVEDNIVNQAIIKKQLQKLGCTFSIANNGQEALDYLSSPSISNPRPAIILMDTQMPIMDGLEAARIIRTQPPFCTDPQLRATPIITLTPVAFREHRQKCLESGMNDILLKPVRFNSLKRVLQHWGRWQVVPNEVGGPGGAWMRVPVWGGPPQLRAYRGPRSLL